MGLSETPLHTMIDFSHVVRYTQISLIQFIQMSVVKHTWVFEKQLSILNLQYFKTELSYDSDFLHIVRLQ